MMASPLEKLRAIAQRARPHDEINETNEITHPSPPAAGVLSSNSFNSSPGTFTELRAATEDLDERAALIENGAGVPRPWAEGYAALASMPAPAGFGAERWRRIVDATGTFLDRWAGEAARLGWSDLDVFGCNADAPDRRFDAMGLVLLLDRCTVAGIDEHGADLVTGAGARQRYRRRPLPDGTISLWQLARAPKGDGL